MVLRLQSRRGFLKGWKDSFEKSSLELYFFFFFKSCPPFFFAPQLIDFCFNSFLEELRSLFIEA